MSRNRLAPSDLKRDSRCDGPGFQAEILLKQAIDEGHQGGAVGRHQQATQEQKKNHDWRQPPLLALTREIPKFFSDSGRPSVRPV
jgi:hypothetical protein